MKGVFVFALLIFIFPVVIAECGDFICEAGEEVECPSDCAEEVAVVEIGEEVVAEDIGEVNVLNDVGEVDMDFGYYERFLNVS